MAGVVYGIGVGPGDPELLTIKAARIIRECDMVGIPAGDAKRCAAYRIALQAVPEMVSKPVLSLPIPMTADRDRLKAAYGEGCAKLAEQLEKNRTIAFLNIGDPTVYGTYMGIHERLLEKGYDARLVSGVPSFCAAAAALGVALGSGEEEIHILPGCRRLREAGDYGGTKILMKSGSRLYEVKRRLVEMESGGKAKAYGVTNCGMPDQVLCREIRDLDEEAGYFTTLIVKEERQPGAPEAASAGRRGEREAGCENKT